MPSRRTVEDIIAATEFPRTRGSLSADLRALGVNAGDTVIVHSSLSSLGWVNGGAVAVVQALCDAVTDAGDIVMPTHSNQNSDPADWRRPPVPEGWVETLRTTLPPFDPDLTPTTHMGQIVEVFRRLPGALRSRHPVTSFAAWGRHAETLTGDHAYENCLGEGSPLAHVYDLDGKVLLMGVGYDRNTSFHLAEYRVADTARRTLSLPVADGGRVEWREFENISDIDDSWLREFGEAFEAGGRVTVGKIGSAESRFFSQRDAVDFAVEWLRQRYGKG
jgi:aminoglycoside 3-N-acetyltransferase